MTEILYQDDALMVINKPSGLLVHRGWAREKVVAMTVVRDHVGHWVHPVHRLDRSASGALVFALTPDVARAMSEHFEQQRVHKRYLALLRGVIEPGSGVIDYAIPKEPGGPRVAAVTHYQRIETLERYSLVEAFPATGRLHQIRRHFKHVFHPLIGDVRYGDGRHNRIFRERFGFHRLALHCETLRFPHPTTGGEVEVHAPLPDDMGTLLKLMRQNARADG